MSKIGQKDASLQGLPADFDVTVQSNMAAEYALQEAVSNETL